MIDTGISFATHAFGFHVGKFLTSESTHNKLRLTGALLEPAFYKTLRKGSKVQWIKEFYTTQITKIQTLFNLANLSIICIYANTLYGKLQEKYSISPLQLTTAYTITSTGIAVLAISAITICAVAAVIKYTDREGNSYTMNGLEIKNITTSSQASTKMVHTTKMVLNLALLIFSQNRWQLAFELGGTCYNFLGNLNLQWLRLSKDFQIPNNATISDVRLEYDILALEKENVVPFCGSHSMTKKNGISFLASKMNTSLLNHASYTRVITRHYTDGRYTHTSNHYKIEVPKFKTLFCPTCKKEPKQNGWSATVWNRYEGFFNGIIYFRD